MTYYNPTLTASEEQSSTAYKINIPLVVERKIRAWCKELPNNEYSGPLFYTVKGSIETNDLEVNVVDFLVLDIGTSMATEFDTSPEVIDYMAMNDLLDCKIGLMHSHNHMDTFFSGTDTNTLDAEGAKMSHFVSLIVNNAGEYNAKITRQVTETITSARKQFKYSSFSGFYFEEPVELEDITRTKVEYFPLEVIKTDYKDPVEEEVKSRVAELRAMHTPAETFDTRAINYQSNFNNFRSPVKPEPYGTYESNRKPVPQQVVKYEPVKPKTSTPAKVKVTDADVVNMVAQLLLCNPMARKETLDKIDVGGWVAKQMSKALQKRFDTIDMYERYMSDFIDYLFWEIDQNFPDTSDSVDYASIIARRSIEYIKKFTNKKSNRYIDIVFDLLEGYIY